MNETIHFRSALDLSTEQAALAVFNTRTKKLLCQKHQKVRGRESSKLLPWIIESLREHSLTLKQIETLTIGTGPGSFTGLRLAASLALGLNFSNPKLKVIGVPSALALAAAISKTPGESIAVIHAGIDKDLIIYEVKIESDGPKYRCQTDVIDYSDLDNDLKEYLSNLDAVVGGKREEKIFTNPEFVKIAPKSHIIECFPANELIFIDGQQSGKNDLLKLNYLRPATNVRMRKARQIV